MSHKKNKYVEINSLQTLGANTAKLARKSVIGLGLAPTYFGYGLIYLASKKRRK